jgi:hypothetical protein
VRVLPLGGGFKLAGIFPAGKIFCSIFFKSLVCYWFCLDERGGITLLASKCYGWRNLKRLLGLKMEVASRASGKWIVS